MAQQRLPQPGVAKREDFDGLRRLFTENECLKLLGEEQGRPELVKIGEAYVANVLKNEELQSWEHCCRKFRAPSSQLWVLRSEAGEVIGSIGAVAEDEPQHLELTRMYVDTSCKKRGYGRALFEVLRDHARSHAVRKLSLSTPSVNTPALAFYEKMGFTRVATKTFGKLEISFLDMELEEDVPSTVVDVRELGDGDAIDVRASAEVTEARVDEASSFETTCKKPRL